MQHYNTPAWFKEFRKREKSGDWRIREHLTQAIMNETGWPRCTAELILRGYGMHSQEINQAAETCLGMKNEEPGTPWARNGQRYETLRDHCRNLPEFRIRLKDGDIGKMPLTLREKSC